MAKMFDPRRILKQISNPLLQQLFLRRGELADVLWQELTETKIEPVYEAWMALPDEQRREVQLILSDVSELSDERGVSALAEEIGKHMPDQAAAFAALEGRADKAMWAYLHASDIFAHASMFAQADALARGRNWIKRSGLPIGPITVSDHITTSISAAMSTFYWPAQMRGRHCRVEHYERANGTHYLFVYLDDYPDQHLVFEGDGTFVKKSGRYAFENVFAFTPNEGALEFYVPGGKRVQGPVHVAFCSALFGIDVDPAALEKPAYRLDHLLNPDLVLPTEHGLADARITRLRLEPRTVPSSYIDVKADPNGSPSEIYQMIAHHLRERSASKEYMRVTQAAFKLAFVGDGKGSPKPLTFNVSCPNSCDLKSRSDEMRVIGERHLKLWGIING